VTKHRLDLLTATVLSADCTCAMPANW